MCHIVVILFIRYDQVLINEFLPSYRWNLEFYGQFFLRHWFALELLISIWLYSRTRNVEYVEVGAGSEGIRIFEYVPSFDLIKDLCLR